MRCRYSSSLRYTLPTPAITVWSISSAPIGLRDLRIRAQARAPSASRRSGSGPSLATTSATSGSSITSHTVGPRRSVPYSAPIIRIRTWPTGSGIGIGTSVNVPYRPEVHVHHAATLVVVEQVLAPGGRLLQDPAVDRSGAVDEPALRAGHHHRGAAEPALMQPGQPVQRVAFWHS